MLAAVIQAAASKRLGEPEMLGAEFPDGLVDKQNLGLV
jgi:hypothetical protein